MTYGSLSSDYCTLWLLEAMVLEMVDIIPNLKVIHYITFLTPRQNLTGGKVGKTILICMKVRKKEQQSTETSLKQTIKLIQMHTCT